MTFSKFALAIGDKEVKLSQSDRAYEEAKKKVEKYLLAEAHSTTWDDVVGNEAARTALIEAIEHPITHADLYKHYGQRPLKGVLLYGPPGCGKTMFGKAAAHVVGKLHGKDAMLLRINGPEIQSPYVGKTEEIIRNIFAFAREYRRVNGHPLVIFIDEADAILPARDGRSAPWDASNVATFLTEMDGLTTSGAFVILATNRPDTIDAALLRDGRCDRKIKVERPDQQAAVKILGNALAGAPLSSESGAPDAAALAETAAEAIFSPYHVVRSLTRVIAKGKNAQEDFLPLTLAHIVNGAMLVGIVDRAKGIAFRRDLADGTITGLRPADLHKAIGEVLEENRGLNHDYALGELLENAPLPKEFGRSLQ
ncbi:hypothetical protein BA190_10010 [Labrys sp. WJW]|nr:hypothetical protein BA190_10010 [Labrys sp. WJW]